MSPLTLNDTILTIMKNLSPWQSSIVFGFLIAALTYPILYAALYKIGFRLSGGISFFLFPILILVMFCFMVGFDSGNTGGLLKGIAAFALPLIMLIFAFITILLIVLGLGKIFSGERNIRDWSVLFLGASFIISMATGISVLIEWVS